MLNPQLIQQIDRLIEAGGLTERQVSIEATGKPDAIRTIRQGKLPTTDKLRKLEAVLKTEVGFLTRLATRLGSGAPLPQTSPNENSDASPKPFDATMAQIPEGSGQLLKSRDERLKAALISIVDLMEIDQKEAALRALWEIAEPSLRKSA